MKNKVTLWIKKVTHVVELLLCIIIGFGILACIPGLFRYLWSIFTANPAMSFTHFQEFLNNILILVVGVEFIIMLITHGNENILGLVLFVIARKMLIYSHSMIDLIMGTLSIAMVFAVMKYLTNPESPHISEGNIFSAAIPVGVINERKGMNLPESERTLGGLVYMFAKQQNLPITDGLSFKVEGYELTVIKVVNGVIEQIKIDDH